MRKQIVNSVVCVWFLETKVKHVPKNFVLRIELLSLFRPAVTRTRGEREAL